MDYNAFLNGVLTRTLNKTEDELSALIFTKAEDSDELVLKDDAVEIVLDLDSSRVENIKKNVKPDPEKLQAQYSRGKKEALEDLEKELRDTYSIDSDKQGTELVSLIVEKNKAKSKLNDEEVKKHPLYLDLEKNTVPKKLYDEEIQKHENYKSEVEKVKQLAIVKRDVLSHFRTLNPVISENPKVAATREEDFLAKFDSYDYDIKEDGDHFVTKNGERIENEQGHPIKFKDFVKIIASANYDFKVQDDKGNTGNQNGHDKQVKVPTSKEEYLKSMAEAKTPEERVKINAAYQESLK